MHQTREARRRGIACWAAAALAAVLTAPVQAQEAEGAQDRAALLQVAREVMEQAAYCALITIDPDGTARARAMDPFPPESDMVVWMGTNLSTRKVEQIRRNPRATLYYFDAAQSAYVSLAGRATIVDDPAEEARYWKPQWEAFYPDRERSYGLIRFVPDWLEVVSVAHGIEGDPDTWQPPVVRFSGRSR